jgi:uncharacterized membrane protein YdjX (TVP38/TMEM64 family)
MMLLGIMAIAGLVMLVGHFEFDNLWLVVLQKIQASGLWGVIIFMLVVSLSVIGMLPSVLLTLGAGMLFGLIKGSIIVVFSESIGALVAFWMGRKIFRARLSTLLKNRTRLRAILELPSPRDWRLVAVTRMLPFFPFKLSNYLFGITPVSGKSFFIGTVVGLWPITLFNVYLGSVAADLISLQSEGGSTTPFQWFLYALGLTCTGVVMLVAIRRATREVDKRTAPSV